MQTTTDMRNLLLIIISINFLACAEKPMDVEIAKQVTEALIKESDAGNYEAVEKLYTPAFNESEPMDVKIEKLNRLKNILGDVQSVEFISSTHQAEFGQPKKLILVYRVKHSKITTIESFSVVEEEGGYRIAAHSVESENL